VFEGRRLPKLLGVCSLFLLVYSGVRGYRLSFTFDEAVSYSMISGEHPEWKASASNHPLNTRLMSWMYRVFGSEEWALRLPNVVAHALYLSFGLLLLRRLTNGWLMILGFAVLNLNPFLLDFFSLARGYGLALGLSMAALYFLKNALESDTSPQAEISLTMSLACAALADLAHFAWLNFHLALLVAAALLLLERARRRELNQNRTTIIAAVVLGAGTVWFLRNLIPRILTLQKAGDFYFGGKDGFLTDTIGSLTHTYFYGQAYPSVLETAIVTITTAAVSITAAALVYTAWKRSEFSFAAVLTIILALSAAASVLEHSLFGTLYPIERVALGFIPLSGLFAVFAIEEIVSGEPLARNVSFAVRACSPLLVLVMVAHFARTANLSHTLSWQYDSETKMAVMEIPKHFDVTAGQVVRVDSYWAYEPSINYYRARLNYTWLLPVKENFDVFYGSGQSFAERGIARYTVLQDYPVTGNLLVRIDR
jgi:hypothetical protein